MGVADSPGKRTSQEEGLAPALEIFTLYIENPQPCG
jgi:hypothetical protein